MRVRQSFDPAVLRIAGEFIWRTFLIGLVLFRDATFRDCAERGATRCCIYRCRRLRSASRFPYLTRVGSITPVQET